jgi:acyl-CoA thioesterase-2
MAEHWEEGVDVESERADMHAFLTGVHPGESPGSWIGDVPEHWHDVMFGGCVIGQSISAFTRDAPAERRLHSLHGYFLRPTGGGAPITYTVEPIRDGKAFSTRRLTASQRGKAVFEAMASFTSDTDGYLYDLPHPSPLPARIDGEVGFGVGGLDAVYFGETARRDDGTYESTDRKWLRLPLDIGDDVHLHTAYLGLASDWTGIGSRPHKLNWDDEEYGIASLDHAVWFHRPPRIDQWLFSDLHALVNFAGRSHVRMTIRDESGCVVASMAQELLVRVL